MSNYIPRVNIQYLERPVEAVESVGELITLDLVVEQRYLEEGSLTLNGEVIWSNTPSIEVIPAGTFLSINASYKHNNFMRLALTTSEDTYILGSDVGEAIYLSGQPRISKLLELYSFDTEDFDFFAADADGMIARGTVLESELPDEVRRDMRDPEIVFNHDNLGYYFQANDTQGIGYPASELNLIRHYTYLSLEITEGTYPEISGGVTALYKRPSDPEYLIGSEGLEGTDLLAHVKENDIPVFKINGEVLDRS